MWYCYGSGGGSGCREPEIPEIAMNNSTSTSVTQASSGIFVLPSPGDRRKRRQRPSRRGRGLTVPGAVLAHLCRAESWDRIFVATGMGKSLGFSREGSGARLCPEQEHRTPRTPLKNQVNLPLKRTAPAIFIVRRVVVTAPCTTCAGKGRVSGCARSRGRGTSQRPPRSFGSLYSSEARNRPQQNTLFVHKVGEFLVAGAGHAGRGGGAGDSGHRPQKPRKTSLSRSFPQVLTRACSGFKVSCTLDANVPRMFLPRPLLSGS